MKNVVDTKYELNERAIFFKSLRDGIATSTSTGRMIAGVLASLAEYERELIRERAAAASRGRHTGRPRALTDEQRELAKRMHVSGEPIRTIATTLSVSRATICRAVESKEPVG